MKKDKEQKVKKVRLRKDGTPYGAKGIPGKEKWVDRDQTFTVASPNQEEYDVLRAMITAFRMILQNLLNGTYVCDSAAASLKIVKKAGRYNVHAVSDAAKADKFREFISSGDVDDTSKRGIRSSMRAAWDIHNENLSKQPLGLKFRSYAWDEGSAFLNKLRTTKVGNTKLPGHILKLSGGCRGSTIVQSARLCVQAHTRSSSYLEIVEETVMHEGKKVECLYLDMRIDTKRVTRVVVQGLYTRARKLKAGEKLKKNEYFKEETKVKPADPDIIKMLRHAKNGRWLPTVAHVTMDKKGRLRVGLGTLRPPKQVSKDPKSRVMEFVSYARTGEGKDEDSRYGFHTLVDNCTNSLDKYRTASYRIDDILEWLYGIACAALKIKRQLAAAGKQSVKGRIKVLRRQQASFTVRREKGLKRECQRLAKRVIKQCRAWGCGTVKVYLPNNTELNGEHAFPWHQLKIAIKSEAEYFDIEAKFISASDSEDRIQKLAYAIDEEMIKVAAKEKEQNAVLQS